MSENFLIINRVNERNDCYRLLLSDGTKLDLPKAELGDYMPPTRKTISIQYYNNLVVRAVFIDGRIVISREPEQLSKLMLQAQQQLVWDAMEQKKVLEVVESEYFEKLPEIFKQRLQMLTLILKSSFTIEALQKEIEIYKLSVLLAKKSQLEIRGFESKTLDVPALYDAKCLAMAYKVDCVRDFRNLEDYKKSEVLGYAGNCTKMPLKNSQAIERYLKAINL